MALPTATSRLKSKCMRDLSDDDKAAFRIFCLGYVPVSNMEVNLDNNDEILRWFELYF